MHILQILDELITLANKAKVLLHISSDSEPVVTLRKDSQDNTTITFKSTCFPFFPEQGFYTFSLNEANLVLDKCRVFVSNLENSTDMSVKSNKLLFEKPVYEKLGYQKKKYPTVVILKDGKLVRYRVLLCKYHQDNPNVRMTNRCHPNSKEFKKVCNCKLIREEEE